jgi:hypothetical protein
MRRIYSWAVSCCLVSGFAIGCGGESSNSGQSSSFGSSGGSVGGRHAGTRYCSGSVGDDFSPGKSEQTQVSVSQSATQLTVSGFDAGVPGLMCRNLSLTAEAAGSSVYFFNEDSCTTTTGDEITLNPAVPPAYVLGRSIMFAVQMRADNGDSADCTFTLNE